MSKAMMQMCLTLLRVFMLFSMENILLYFIFLASHNFRSKVTVLEVINVLMI